MSNLRYRWLLFRGYKPYRYVTVAHSWDGEDPPAFGYYAELKMRKGASVKSVKFEHVSSGQELRDLIKEQQR